MLLSNKSSNLHKKRSNVPELDPTDKSMRSWILQSLPKLSCMRRRYSKGIPPRTPPPSIASIVGFIVGGRTSITNVAREWQIRHVDILNRYSSWEAGVPNNWGHRSHKAWWQAMECCAGRTKQYRQNWLDWTRLSSWLRDKIFSCLQSRDNWDLEMIWWVCLTNSVSTSVARLFTGWGPSYPRNPRLTDERYKVWKIACGSRTKLKSENEDQVSAGGFRI